MGKVQKNLLRGVYEKTFSPAVDRP
jgi:hypothetical protein